ncbi:MAG: thiamine/thiamine pyrophosphate ABC transporter, permease protein [Gammaproteobacteria bacterium]|nr:MAG: thiamine/thiamine pyrophosphate ABC transporter, permease protein [Gammaproteobacteria bacterium]
MPAVTVILLLATLYGNSLWQLLQQQALDSYWDIVTDSYVLRVVQFSLWQAFLSASLSVIFGLAVAHALFYQDFIGKRWLLKIFSLSMVLPVLVAIFGILGAYGKVGWLAQWLSALGMEKSLNIYGLSGILLAHTFFNIPLAANIFLNALHAIPNQQRRLAAQLGVVNWPFVRLVEWPYLRTCLPSVFALIFMLCFTSFAIVLTMGGGPKYTTLEVAIYQALTFDFELQRAAVFALMQCVFCLALFALSSRLSKAVPTTANVGSTYVVALPTAVRVLHGAIIVAVVGFIGLPLLNIVVSAFDLSAWQSSLSNPTLYKALAFSLTIALCAGSLSVLMSVALLLGAREFHFAKRFSMAANIVNAGMVILAVPTLVLAVGLFLLLRQLTITTPMLFAVVVLCNALMSMPFVLRILSQPLYDNMSYYERLCQSLGVRGWARFRHIEWHSIQRPLQNAFALATAFSLGDFTAIALFGNNDFTSLPRLLYQQLGNYRGSEASVSAFILLALCTMIFIFSERSHDST